MPQRLLAMLIALLALMPFYDGQADVRPPTAAASDGQVTPATQVHASAPTAAGVARYLQTSGIPPVETSP